MKNENQTKERIVKTVKKSIGELPFALASSIPGGIGFAIDLVKGSYDDVLLDEKIQKFTNEINDLKNSSYEKVNIDFIELYFSKKIEINDAEFMDTVQWVIEDLNKECTVEGTYGCVCEKYAFYEKYILIEFEDTYTKEYVDEFIEKFKEGMESYNWCYENSIEMIKYY